MPAAATPFNGGGASLRFPREVGSDEVPNFVTFRPMVVEYGETVSAGPGATKKRYGKSQNRPDYTSYKSGTGTAAPNRAGVSISNPFENVIKSIGGALESIAQGAIASFNTSYGNIDLNFGQAASGGNLLNARLNLGALNLNIGSGPAQNPNTVKNLQGVHLYLPQEIKNTVSADYTQAKVGAAANEAIDFINNEITKANAIDAMKEVATAVIQESIPDRFSNAVQVGFGRAKNNYTYAIFNGMRHREFSYNFTLVAKDARESTVIKDICNTFIFYMLPGKSPDSFHFFDVPCMWDISYRRYMDPIPFLDQPKKCFLTAADVTYNKGSLGHTHNDGAPLTVDLSLKFMELEPLLRTDGDRVDGENKGAAKILQQLRDLGSNGSDSGGGGGGK